MADESTDNLMTHDEIGPAIHDSLIELRERLGLSEAEMATKIGHGLTAQHIYNIEHYYSPSLERTPAKCLSHLPLLLDGYGADENERFTIYGMALALLMSTRMRREWGGWIQKACDHEQSPDKWTVCKNRRRRCKVELRLPDYVRQQIDRALVDDAQPTYRSIYEQFHLRDEFGISFSAFHRYGISVSGSRGIRPKMERFTRGAQTTPSADDSLIYIDDLLRVDLANTESLQSAQGATL